MPRKALPIQPLFCRLLPADRFRADTLRPLAYDPIESSRASFLGARPNVDDRRSRCRRLAPQTMRLSFWLRPLRCSRLSPGVLATMSRSDSSGAPSCSVLPLPRRFLRRGSACVGAPEVSLGHTRLYSTHPDAKHVTGSCAGLRLHWQTGPPVPPNRVHFRFGLGFGSDPSPASSRGRLSLPTGGRTFAQVPRRDLNPLDTCAARRTNVGLRRRPP
jgi:hypothetical protein